MPDETKITQAKAIWDKISREDLEVRLISDTFYAFGSEGAVLTLMSIYRKAFKEPAGLNSPAGKPPRIRAFYSEPEQRWCFAFDVRPGD